MDKPSKNRQSIITVHLNNDVLIVMKKVNKIKARLIGGHDFLAIIADGHTSYFNFDNIIEFEVENMENQESENG